MLPESQHTPPFRFEPIRGLDVTFLIAFELSDPEVPIVPRYDQMKRAAMPKAPIDKNSDTRTYEDHIGSRPPNSSFQPIPHTA